MCFVLLSFSYWLYVKSNVQMCASFETSCYCFPYKYVKTTMCIHVILFVTVMWMWVYQLFPNNTSSYNDPKLKHTLFWMMFYCSNQFLFLCLFMFLFCVFVVVCCCFCCCCCCYCLTHSVLINFLHCHKSNTHICYN